MDTLFDHQSGAIDILITRQDLCVYNNPFLPGPLVYSDKSLYKIVKNTLKKGWFLTIFFNFVNPHNISQSFSNPTYKSNI